MSKTANYGTLFIWKPDIFTFRLLGFGVFVYREEAFRHLDGKFERELWLVPILPGWKLAYLWPWN